MAEVRQLPVAEVAQPLEVKVDSCTEVKDTTEALDTMELVANEP